MTYTSPSKRKIQCNLRIRPELHEYLKDYAARHGRSFNGEMAYRLEMSKAIDTYEAMRQREKLVVVK